MYWTRWNLKERGWTEELIREKLWDQGGEYPASLVVAAEKEPWFRKAVAGNEKAQTVRSKSGRTLENTKPRLDRGLTYRKIQPALDWTAETLSRAWEQANHGTGPAAMLAELYHRQILKKIAQAGYAVSVDQTAKNDLKAFLNVEQAGKEKTLAALKKLIHTAVWMGNHQNEPLVAETVKRYPALVLTAAEKEIRLFSQAQPEVSAENLLQQKDFPQDQLLKHHLGYLYSVHYIPLLIHTRLDELVSLNPRDEYPLARAMTRHFILHIGGTNTGKTHAGLQRLMQARSGIYLGPLRLLALEAQEIMLDAGVACSLTTGEEEDLQEGDTHIAATVEKLNCTQVFEVAVIDECQMIADSQRGYAWTRAILGVRAPEIHLCAAPQAKDLLIQLIVSCHDSYEIREHSRKIPLVSIRKRLTYLDIQPGDALITFSKIGVLSIAEDLRAQGKRASIIYGALPYATRRKQVESFLSGQTQYVVSTDAIGMGLNLPIRRVIFMETSKFDGTERRLLKPEEVQQIAGRAGRYGMYEKGYVGAMEGVSYIGKCLKTEVPPLQYAVVGFSDLIASVGEDILRVLEIWSDMPVKGPYKKLDISRYIVLISQLRAAGFHLDREIELRAANIPFDETNQDLTQYFFQLLRAWTKEKNSPMPKLEKEKDQYTLPQLEEHYRKLDLYYSFSRNFQNPVDQDSLYTERMETADAINEILLHKLKNNIRFCSRCGKPLPLHTRGRLCDSCYQKLLRERGEDWF